MENKDQIDFTTLVVVGTLGVLCLVFFIIFIVLLYQKRMLAQKTLLVNSEIKHQKKLLDNSLEIAEKERQTIARNVHDDIGISLTVLKLNLDMLQKNLVEKERADELIAGSYDLIDFAMLTVRNIYNDILPPTLTKAGFVKGIGEICSQISLSGSARVIFKSEIEKIEFDKNTELQLYHLIKEVLNNTLRHAKPSFIEISLKKSENELRVIILHNGMGISTAKINELAETSTGLGLKSILTRTELINGTIDFAEAGAGRSEVIIKTALRDRV